MTDVNEAKIFDLQSILRNKDFCKNHPEMAKKYREELNAILELKNHDSI